MTGYIYSILLMSTRPIRQGARLFATGVVLGAGNVVGENIGLFLLSYFARNQANTTNFNP